MKRFCGIALLYITSMALGLHAYAGVDIKGDWYKGELVLQDGQKLKGELQLNFALNTVLLKQDTIVKAFSPYSVSYFKFKEGERIRTFYTLFYQQPGVGESLMFFELVFNNNFALFNREAIIQKEYAIMADLPCSINPNDELTVIVYQYYLFLPEGKLIRFDTNSTDVSSILASNKQERKQINNYIFENGLDLNNRSDLIKVLDHYINKRTVGNTTAMK